MGAHLVKLMVVHWSPVLSDGAFRVLTTMAITALDQPKGLVPAATYFGGHEFLAMKMYRERNGSMQAALKKVTRAIAELLKLGAIELIRRAQTGSHASYLLRLDRAA